MSSYSDLESTLSIIGIIIFILTIVLIIYPFVMMIIISKINKKLSNIENLLTN